jgi:bacteriorhodopsin
MNDKNRCVGVFFLLHNSSFILSLTSAILSTMNEVANETTRVKYRWPWFLLGAVLLAIALAIVWVGWEVRHVEQETNFSAPLPSQK